MKPSPFAQSSSPDWTISNLGGLCVFARVILLFCTFQKRIEFRRLRLCLAHCGDFIRADLVENAHLARLSIRVFIFTQIFLGHLVDM